MKGKKIGAIDAKLKANRIGQNECFIDRNWFCLILFYTLFPFRLWLLYLVFFFVFFQAWKISPFGFEFQMFSIYFRAQINFPWNMLMHISSNVIKNIIQFGIKATENDAVCASNQCMRKKRVFHRFKILNKLTA